MTRKRLTFRKNVMYSIFTISVFGCLFEVMLHKFEFSFQPMTHPGSFGTHFEATDTADYVQDPTRFWIPKPDSIIQADWVGKNGATINTMGLRGSLPTIPKPGSTIRVLCLGDSGTFGWGMNDDQTWPHYLEIRLNSLAANRRDTCFDVVNAGVNGYSTYQAVEQYFCLETQLQPDIVMIAAGRNDFSPVPVTDASRPVITSWQITAMKWISGTKVGQLILFASQRKMMSSLLQGTSHQEQQTIRVEDDEYRCLMTRLALHCKEHGRPLIYIHRAGRIQIIREMVDSYPIGVVDLKRLSSIGQVNEFMEGGHPDAPVYDLIAEEIVIQLIRQCPKIQNLVDL